MPILITGFASVEGASNSSGILIESLMTDLPNSLEPLKYKIRFALIDANTDSLRPILEDLLRSSDPTDCVFVGQAPGRNNISLESVATNMRFTGPPTVKGGSPQSDIIDISGPSTCQATMPNMNAMIQQLQKAEIPAAMSNNAGNSLCNQILYHGLRHAETNDNKPRCGFVHIPALPGQVIARWPDYPFMPLEMARQALTIILLDLLQLKHETIS